MLQSTGLVRIFSLRSAQVLMKTRLEMDSLKITSNVSIGGWVQRASLVLVQIDWNELTQTRIFSIDLCPNIASHLQFRFCFQFLVQTSSSILIRPEMMIRVSNSIFWDDIPSGSWMIWVNQNINYNFNKITVFFLNNFQMVWVSRSHSKSISGKLTALSLFRASSAGMMNA